MIHRKAKDVVVASKGSTTNSRTANGAAKGKRRVYFEPQPMAAVEYFIFASTILFVGVFAVMQVVFLYKLHVYEASFWEGSQQQQQQQADMTPPPPVDGRALQVTEEKQSAFVPASNRQRIEFMANKTQRKFSKWPPLEALVDMQEGTVIGNPQFLLDFAILGFEKSGTFALKQIVYGHKKTDGLLEENINLYMNRPHQFVADLYYHRPSEDYYRFYNNNNDIYQPCSLKNIHQYFPETKLVIAVRHPVRYVSIVTNYKKYVSAGSFVLTWIHTPVRITVQCPNSKHSRSQPKNCVASGAHWILQCSDEFMLHGSCSFGTLVVQIWKDAGNATGRN
jgi:hypothetical protein